MVRLFGAKIRNIVIFIVCFLYSVGFCAPLPQISPSQQWQQIQGNAASLSISFDGNVWHVGTSNTIWQWIGGSSIPWQQFGGDSKSIALGSTQGFVWNINAAGTLTYRLGGWGTGVWNAVSDCVGRKFRQIACGSSGQAWCLDDADNIYFREGITKANPVGTSWTQISGALHQISVGKDDQVWGVNSGGFVYTRLGVNPNGRVGTVWIYVPTPVIFKHVSVGLDGSVWGVGTDNNIYFRKYTWAYNEGSNAYGNTMDWELVANPQNIAFAQIFAGRDGELLALDNSGNIWFRYYRTPLLVDGKKVVIVSYKNISTPKLLIVTGGKYLSTTGVSASDAASQYTVLNFLASVTPTDFRIWFGFKSTIASNNNLQAVATADVDPLYAVRFYNLDFSDISHSLEHWTVVPISANGYVALLNQGTNAYLSAPDSTGSWNALNRVWTTYNGTNRAGESGPGWCERFKIMTPEEASAAGLFTVSAAASSIASVQLAAQNVIATVVKPVSAAAVPVSTITLATSSIPVTQTTPTTSTLTSLYDPATPPGGTNFTLLGKEGTSDVHTVFGWTLPKVGNGLIRFKANAASNIWVVFGQTAAYESGKCVAVGIGVSDNTKSVIRTTLDATNKVAKADSIKPGLEGVSESWDDYWVMIRNGKILYGKGTTPGKNVILQWSNELINTLKYVGFGCKGSGSVELDQIKVAAAIVEKSASATKTESAEKQKATTPKVSTTTQTKKQTSQFKNVVIKGRRVITDDDEQEAEDETVVIKKKKPAIKRDDGSRVLEQREGMKGKTKISN